VTGAKTLESRATIGLALLSDSDKLKPFPTTALNDRAC
jgi:hypothetical protein